MEYGILYYEDCKNMEYCNTRTAKIWNIVIRGLQKYGILYSTIAKICNIVLRALQKYGILYYEDCKNMEYCTTRTAKIWNIVLRGLQKYGILYYEDCKNMEYCTTRTAKIWNIVLKDCKNMEYCIIWRPENMLLRRSFLSVHLGVLPPPPNTKKLVLKHQQKY